jgi:hypothetical protein
VRLWSLHPCYLDAKGLVALWREGLLARAVLKKETQGYKHHPQLERFRFCRKPVVAINQYLWGVYEEATRRGYNFDVAKLGRKESCVRILITAGQLAYEWEHLCGKLKQRNRAQYQKNQEVEQPSPHPLFKVRAGDVATWEKVKRGKLGSDLES